MNCRHLGQDWQLTNQHKQALEQYYDANKLLVDCLNSYCDGSPAREEILRRCYTLKSKVCTYEALSIETTPNLTA